MLASRITVVLLPKLSNEHRHDSTKLETWFGLPQLPTDVLWVPGHEPRSHMAFSHVSSISLLCKTFSIFLCLSWPWQFWRTQVSYFVQSPSTGSVWCFLMVRLGLWVLEKMPQSSEVLGSMISTWLLTGEGLVVVTWLCCFIKWSSTWAFFSSSAKK